MSIKYKRKLVTNIMLKVLQFAVFWEYVVMENIPTYFKIQMTGTNSSFGNRFTIIDDFFLMLKANHCC